MSMNADMRSAMNQLLTLTEAAPEKHKEKVKISDEITNNKCKQIANILSQYPELKTNKKVVDSIFGFTDRANTKEVKEFRKQLITDLSKVAYRDEGNIRIIGARTLLPEREMTQILRTVPKDMGQYNEQTGVLTLSEKSLKSLDKATFLKFTENRHITKIALRQEDGQTIVYQGSNISRLIVAIDRDELEPKEVLDKITVKFPKSGDEVVELKGKVLANWEPEKENEDTYVMPEHVELEEFLNDMENSNAEEPASLHDDWLKQRSAKTDNLSEPSSPRSDIEEEPPRFR